MVVALPPPWMNSMEGAMFEAMLEAAEDILDYPITAPEDVEDGYYAVIYNKKIVAAPFYMAETMPFSSEFFLLTTHARLAAFFHEERDKPVWLCKDAKDFYKFHIPTLAGIEENWVLTSQKQASDVQPLIQEKLRKGRIYHSLSGHEADLIRAFFPQKYDEMF